MTTHVPRTIALQVTKTDLEVQDLYINIDDSTSLETDDLFKLETLPARQYNAYDYVLMDMSFEMNLNQV